MSLRVSTCSVLFGLCLSGSSLANVTASSSPGSPITDLNTTTDVINIGASETITDVTVDVQITHTFTGDLDVSLQSPAGTTVILFQDICGSTDDPSITLDDAAANPAGTTCPAAGTTERPVDPLSAFDGENTMGNWTLSVTDDAIGDQGTLDFWQLNIISTAATAAVQNVPVLGPLGLVLLAGLFSLFGLRAERGRAAA